MSSAFFRSPEFQDRGYFVYRFYPVTFGRKPDFVEFVPDFAKVSGFLSDAELEAAKVAFITEFMSRPAFVAKFNGLTDTQYVDTLLATAQCNVTSSRLLDRGPGQWHAHAGGGVARYCGEFGGLQQVLQPGFRGDAVLWVPATRS